MAIEEQERQLHYRRAKIRGKSEQLHALLAKAVRTLKYPTDRLEPLSDSGPGRRFINYVSTHQGMLCGHVLTYSEGAPQFVLLAKPEEHTGDEAASYPLEVLLAQEKDGAKTEFLESILYFCMRGDNVLVLQSRGLRARGFEEHIDWILREAKIFEPENKIFLADQPKLTAARAIKQKGVKRVSIGIPMFDVEAALTSEDQKAQIKVAGPIVNALKSLLGAKFDELKLKDALNGNISATISLAWTRQTTGKAQNVLDQIAVAMRNIEADDVAIKLNRGGTIKGDQLKLLIPVTIKLKDGVVQQTSLFKAMRDALTTAIEENLIPA
ncbi:MAG: hypothetical protein ACLPV2_18485 [Steroidobacteraceae bacterium]